MIQPAFKRNRLGQLIFVPVIERIAAQYGITVNEAAQKVREEARYPVRPITLKKAA